MNCKHILISLAATTLIFSLAGCGKDDYPKIEQGRVIAFNKEAKEVVLLHDSAMDAKNPVYDVLPPAVFKLPVDPAETGAEPTPGQRLKLDVDKKIVVIFDNSTQKIVELPITVVDLQQPIDKDHPLVFDKQANKAKKFPVVDRDKKTITIYSG